MCMVQRQPQPGRCSMKIWRGTEFLVKTRMANVTGIHTNEEVNVNKAAVLGQQEKIVIELYFIFLST